MDITLIIAVLLGVFIIAVGGMGLFWCSKQSFHRRNALGMEEFESYGQMVLLRIIEGLVMLISILAMLGGIILLFWKLVGFAVLGPNINGHITKFLSQYQ